MANEEQKPKRRRPLLRGAALFILATITLVGSEFLRHPDALVPPRWNVFEPLSVSEPITPITGWKLDWATNDPQLCADIMQTAGRISVMTDIVVDENCGIEGRIRLRSIGRATLDLIETSCATALRLAMWEHHGIQPAAREILGSDVKKIRHIGSYNCRPIAGTERWSTHSTASAIDITGFDLTDGTRVRLLKDWEDDDPKAQFLRRVRDASCDWFGATLGPDYNAAHADHFHLQNRGWGTCR